LSGEFWTLGARVELWWFGCGPGPFGVVGKRDKMETGWVTMEEGDIRRRLTTPPRRTAVDRRSGAPCQRFQIWGHGKRQWRRQEYFPGV